MKKRENGEEKPIWRKNTEKLPNIVEDICTETTVSRTSANTKQDKYE